MANIQVKDLTEQTAVNDNDNLYIQENGGTPKRVEADTLGDYALARITDQTADTSLTGTDVLVFQESGGTVKKITWINAMASIVDAYSATETLTNKVFLTYPVYRKVVDFGALPNTTSKNVAHGISGTFTIVLLSGFAFNSSNDLILLPAGHPNDVLNLWLQATSTNITVETGLDVSAFTKSWITIEYVKVAL
jgi:hypothetical protein